MTTTAQVFEAYRTWMQAGGYAANTIRDACQLLRRADARLPYGVWTATDEEIVGLLSTPGWSNQTRATYRQHLRRAYQWAHEHGWIDLDPSTQLRRPPVPPGIPRPATDAQVAAALHTAWPWRLHVTLAAYGGLRCCEVAHLDRADIGEADLRIVGKGGRTRLVPTTAPVWAAVQRLPAGPVTRGSAGWVSKRTAEHLRRHGIPISMHMLRHWYATNALDRCGNLRVVQELLGHSSPATTAVYTQVSDAQKRAAVSDLPMF